MKIIHLKPAVAAVALFAAAGVASAAVTFDPETGRGFVGKGDVQNAFGWNNKQLQTNAAGVSFKYVETIEYEVICTWVTGPDHNRTTHNRTRTLTSGVDSDIEYDARAKTQINGYKLKRWIANAPTETGDDEPGVGDNCQALGITDVSANAVVSDVMLLPSSGGGLYVLAPGFDPVLISP